MGFAARLSEVNGVIFVCVLFFACSSWLALYGVFVELPILVTVLPEGWTLPSIIGILIVASNVAPLIYTLSEVICRGKIDSKKKEVFTIFVIIGTGATLCFLSSFVWDRTGYLFGEERGLAFLSIVFCLSLTSSTSNIVFLPFMARYPATYMPAYMAGEAFGGMISGFVGFIQGSSSDPICLNKTELLYNETGGVNYTQFTTDVTRHPPRISVSAFFLFLFGMMLLSLLAFTLLSFAPFCRKHMVDVTQKDCSSSIEDNPIGDPEKSSMLQGSSQSLNSVKVEEKCPSENNNDEQEKVKTKGDEGDGSTYDLSRFVPLLFISAGVACFMFGFCPSILSYAALPYSNMTYSMAIKAYTVVNPLTALSTFFIRTRSMRVYVVIASLASVLVAVITYMAATSPEPPLVHHPAGSPLAVITYALLTICLSFLRTSIATAIHKEQGHQGLQWVGRLTIIGVVFGAVVSFLLINVFHVFVDVIPCE